MSTTEQEVLNDVSPAEEEASHMGWMPQERWVAEGKPAEKWVDAKTFLERGENILPIVRQNLHKTREELEELRRTVGQQTEVMNRRLAQERREKEQAIEQLQQERAKAITQGDGAKVVQIEKQIANAAQELQPVHSEPQPSAEAIAWHQRNPWYTKDIRLTGIANGLGATYRQMNPMATEKQVLEYVEQEIASMNPQRKPTSPDAPTGGASSRSRSREPSFADLPDDVRDVARRTIRGGAKVKGDDGKWRPMTEADYARQYFGNPFNK